MSGCMETSEEAASCCKSCSRANSEHTFVQIISVENDRVIRYTIPSFPVFHADLLHIMHTWSMVMHIRMMDSFRLVDTLNGKDMIMLCRDYSKAFFIESNEFTKSIDTTNPHPMNGSHVFVNWDWTCITISSGGDDFDDERDDDDDDAESSEDNNHSVDYSDLDESEENKPSDLVYSAVFKLMYLMHKRAMLSRCTSRGSTEEKKWC